MSTKNTATATTQLVPTAAAPTGSLDLASAFGTAAPITKGGKKTKIYPAIPTTPVLVEVVDQFIKAQSEFKSAEGRLEAAKAQLNEAAPQTFFTANHLQREPSSGVVASGTGDNEAMVTFTNRYPATARPVIEEVIGSELTAKYFHDKLSIRINGDDVPADKRQLFITKMAQLGMELGIFEIIKAGVTVVVTPNTEFHAERQTALTAQQNVELHSVLPCVMQCKVRGVNVEAPAPVVPAVVEGGKKSKKSK